MAVPTNTSLTYSAVGIREDLSNVIYNIAPLDTPFSVVAVEVLLTILSLSGRLILLVQVQLTSR